MYNTKRIRIEGKGNGILKQEIGIDLYGILDIECLVIIKRYIGYKIIG